MNFQSSCKIITNQSSWYYSYESRVVRIGPCLFLNCFPKPSTRIKTEEVQGNGGFGRCGARRRWGRGAGEWRHLAAPQVASAQPQEEWRGLAVCVCGSAACRLMAVMLWGTMSSEDELRRTGWPQRDHGWALLASRQGAAARPRARAAAAARALAWPASMANTAMCGSEAREEVTSTLGLGASSGDVAEASSSSSERFGRPCLARERANRERRGGRPGFPKWASGVRWCACMS
jgi:hypothetical protein